MIRNIIKIDADRCIGCGKCADACAEGAIKMISGKAALVSDAYCDGLGACLPSCPVDAISIVKREAAPFTEPKASKGLSKHIPAGGIPMACPGSSPHTIIREKQAIGDRHNCPGRLSQWPIQLRLVPTTAPYLNGCNLLLAADCSAFACGDFHDRYIMGRTVIIGCPKLDPAESWNKLKDIIALNDIRSITVTRMDVPCCSALANSALNAIKACGKEIPLRIITVFADGHTAEGL